MFKKLLEKIKNFDLDFSVLSFCIKKDAFYLYIFTVGTDCGYRGLFAIQYEKDHDEIEIDFLFMKFFFTL